ncbi:cobyrinate a,c-diamide synthase [Desulfopila sp. IMCC35006]|uniref:cobyrinate a,c-diamide synthase n=1 Tax=Desulfopila sp. IMCC35006 TaxID=2569542 RepID=UPI0010AD7B64|nr:cobyrinate a,c-diamide synthase [Desulfopila sp. IMCC35006]TKB26614.1 cobyrinate a,c-diamide synthase [Desulfopila sp. IMCC35006]
MSDKTSSRFIVSGTSSGSGKTTVALGLMAAFREKGCSVQPFKCGPDFIDPGLHRLVTGQVSRNLDLWMCGENFTRDTLAKNSRNADVTIIEGVMGMFDGGISSSGSLAETLDIPGILVLDVRSMAESAAAIVKGFEMLRPKAAPKGIILNRVASKRHLQLVSDAIEEHCQAEILGHLPRTLAFEIPSRHLGLLTSDEAPLDNAAIQLLARTVAEHVDLDRIEHLFQVAKESQPDILSPSPAKKERCRIGVARDKAFCFYYEDNFDILRNAGCELIFFSPLADPELPVGLDALYLGGGYPELYAEMLSNNHSMISAIRQWIECDRPVYAECGGFMYLTEGITDQQNVFHCMIGAFPVKAHMQKTRASLGYREIQTLSASCFGPAGTVLRGHEFHYSSIDRMPDHIARLYSVNNGTSEGYTYKNVLGGYMHLHFGFTPQTADEFINFINTCRE